MYTAALQTHTRAHTHRERESQREPERARESQREPERLSECVSVCVRACVLPSAACNLRVAMTPPPHSVCSALSAVRNAGGTDSTRPERDRSGALIAGACPLWV